MDDEPKKRMVKLHWQAIAGVIKKATGYPYSSGSARGYYWDEGFSCNEYRNGSVRVSWMTGRSKIGTNKYRRDEALEAMTAALRGAGYTVKEQGNVLLVTKEAPPVPPIKPFHFVNHKPVAEFEWPGLAGRFNRHYPDADRHTVTLSRTIHQTDKGTFPQSEYVIERRITEHDKFGSEKADEITIDGDWSKAATQFALFCRDVVLEAIITEEKIHGYDAPPPMDELTDRVAAWEVEMAAYKEQYPGPEPEIARGY